MKSSHATLLIDGEPQGFEIHALPPNKLVPVTSTVRCTDTGHVLMIGARGKIYAANMASGRRWSWTHGISDKVAKSLAAAGVITQSQADGHIAARNKYAQINDAYWTLRHLKEDAERHGITLSGEGYDALVALAAQYEEDE